MGLPKYRGFSSYEYETNKTFSLNDIELVKSDLLNHIFTRRGERVMMPNFGTSIPDIVFDPLDDTTVELVRDDILEVLNFDPRVELIDLVTLPNFDQNSIFVSADCFYIEFQLQQNMDFNITFEPNS